MIFLVLRFLVYCKSLFIFMVFQTKSLWFSWLIRRQWFFFFCVHTLYNVETDCVACLPSSVTEHFSQATNVLEVELQSC